ncbi:MAG: hypothetical protein CM15mV145_360 [uncultured marine virus]|nr:MAG: hypothetical protein CM15mV145_360 [uncultured marine virus]
MYCNKKQRNFLEKLTDEDVYLDCHITTASTGSSYAGANGFSHKQLPQSRWHCARRCNSRCKRQFSLSRVSSSTQIGFNYTSTAKTLPITFQLGNSLVSGEKDKKDVC